jgi:hypothetical protein
MAERAPVHVGTVERALKRQRTDGHVRDVPVAPRERLLSRELWVIAAGIAREKSSLYF